MKKVVNFFKKQNIYVLFSICFFLFLLIGLLPLEISNGSFLFGGFYRDGFKQHLVFMNKYVSEIKDAFSSGVFPQFSFQQGLGEDFVYAYTYYGLFDPLNFIAYLLPIKYIDVSYSIIIHLKLYLTGFVLIYVLKRMKIEKNFSLLISSLFYVTSSLIFFTAVRHPIFMTPFILLPLIILGCHKIYNKEGPGLLIVCGLISFISHYYMTFYILFAIELYAVIILIINSKKYNFKTAFKDFFLVNLAFGIGILSASFVLLTQINAVLECGRIASKGLASIDMKHFSNTILSFFIPISGGRYTQSVGSIIALFLIALYLPKNYKKPESIFFIIVSICLFIYPIGYLLNMGSYVNNRYSFIRGFFIAYIIAQVFDKWDTFEKKDVLFAAKFIACALLFYFVSLILYLSESLPIGWYVVIALILIVAAFISIYKLIFVKLHHPFFEKTLNKKTFSILMFVSIFINVISIVIGYVPDTTKANAYQNLNKPSDYGAIYKDKDFFRVSESLYYEKFTNMSNDNIINGYNSTYSYNTMTNKNAMKVFDYFNVLNLNKTVGYNNFDNRAYLNNINSVKYIMIRENEKVSIPFGFSLCDTISLKKLNDYGVKNTTSNNDEYENVYIYKNDYFLNFGYVYHEYSLKKELKDLNLLSVESSLFDSVILEKDVNMNKNDNISALTYRAANFTNFTNLVKNFEKYKVTSDWGTISFEIPTITNSEVILYIKNINNLEDKSFQTIYETKSHRSYNQNYNYGSMFYTENSEHIVNLGYYEDETNLIVDISLPKGTYSIEDIGYYIRRLNKTDISEKTLAFNEESLTNLTFSNNQFSGNISLKDDGVLFVSIPHHKGFKAYANNQEVEILKANIGYMGIYLEKGDYDIKFVYETPGLKTGKYISIVFASLGTLWIILNKVYKNKKQKLS